MASCEVGWAEPQRTCRIQLTHHVIRKDTLDLQRAHISRLRADLKESDAFRKIYNFVFDYAKTEGQKSMRESTFRPAPPSSSRLILNAELEIANELWSLLLPLDPDAKFPLEHLRWWQDFLVQRGNRAVSKDTWNLVRRACPVQSRVLTKPTPVSGLLTNDRSGLCEARRRRCALPRSPRLSSLSS